MLVIEIKPRLFGHGFHRHERSAQRILPAPYGMHRVTHFPEGVLELLAAPVAGHLLHRSEIERILRDLVISVLHQEGIVIKIPASGKIHISKCIVIRCIVLLGAVEPSVPVPEIPLVESHMIVVEEVRRPASSRLCQGGLRHHGITFYIIHERIYDGYQDVPHLAENIVERLVDSGHAELHLGHMASFVDGKHRGPGHRLGLIWRRDGEEVHPLRCPCYRAVGRVVCVKHDRHQPAVALPDNISGTSRKRSLVFLKLVSVCLRQRVAALWIYDTEGLRVHIVPPEPARIVACHIELCRCDSRNQEA